MRNRILSVRPVFAAALAAGLTAPGLAYSQDLDLPARSGWSVRLDAVTLFNVKASIQSISRVAGAGVYDDGFVLPDNGGTASGKTWNWGFNSPGQITGGQLVLNRFDNVPQIGQHDLNVSNPLLGGEIVAAYQLTELRIGKRPAGLSFEFGYGYSSFSAGMNYLASGTASHTTDGYSLGGILAPVPPYAGTAAGPGPLIGLGSASHSVLSSSAATAFQGTLNTTLHGLRLGPALDLGLAKRLNLSWGLGFASVFTDASLRYYEASAFSNPAMPAISPANVYIGHGKWCPGFYSELRLNCRLSERIGAFVGGDFQFNSSSSFGDAGHQVKLDLGTTYGAKAGLIWWF